MSLRASTALTVPAWPLLEPPLSLPMIQDPISVKPEGFRPSPQTLLTKGLGLLWAAHTPHDALTPGKRLINEEPVIGSKVHLECSALGDSAKSNSPVE